MLWIAGTIAVLLVAFVVYNELTMNRREVAVEASASPTPAARRLYRAGRAAPGRHSGARAGGRQLAGRHPLGSLVAAGHR